MLLAMAALGYALLAGLRWPGQWAMTHLLFDYSHGFIKRGLVGEGLRLLIGDVVPYAALAAFCFSVFAAWIAMLLILVWSVARSLPQVWLFVAVAFLSPGFVFTVNIVGYPDHLGLLVVLVCLVLPVTPIGLALRMALCCAMLAAHETFLLTFFAVVVMDVLLRSRPDRAAVAGIGAACVWIGAAVATGLIASAVLPKADILLYQTYLQTRALDFRVRYDAVAVVFTTGQETWEFARTHLHSTRMARLVFLHGFWLLPLPVYFGLIATSLIVRDQRVSWMMRARVLALWAAILLPLCLIVIAQDTLQFFGMTQVSALLCLVTVLRVRASAMQQIGNRARPGLFLVLLAMVGIATDLGLLNGPRIARPPFVSEVNWVLNVLTGEVPFLEIPTH